MSANPTDRPVVLVVDDEKDVADTYAFRLEDHYETRIAYGGREALERLDETVDVVVLDRRMPDRHGDDVLAEIRERGHDCIVIMATAVEADLNVLEMDFDDYLTKPIPGDRLVETVERHLETAGGDERFEEFFRLVSKTEVLEEELSRYELAESEDYQRAKRRAEELGARLRETTDDFEEIVATYRELHR